MTDREEREEHIKRLEAALACEEKQSSGKCSKQTCDDNCDLLYEQGNWGEWKETLRYAINSLKIDLKYDLLYEETSEQKEPSSSEIPTGSIIDWNNCHTSEQLESIPTTKNDLGVDCISRKSVIEEMEKRHAEGDYITKGFINSLPSVTPIRPKGHWISHREHCENLGVMPSGLGAYGWCSNCDCGIDVRAWGRNHYNFCPNCGADMRGEKE